MNALFHRLDAEYAALPDTQIEALWRHALVHDRDAREPLVRQLVLRAAVVVDATCRRECAAAGLSEADALRAAQETGLRLMSRLRLGGDVRDIRALAHQIACEVVADPERRRCPTTVRFAPRRATLRLVTAGDPR